MPPYFHTKYKTIIFEGKKAKMAKLYGQVEIILNLTEHQNKRLYKNENDSTF
jgi:hypothetical protein